MNIKRVVSSTIVIISLSLIMTKFQNCGGGSDVSPTDNRGDYNPDVQLPDQINEKLSFIETLIVTKHDADEVNFDGLCGEGTEGKIVNWEIRHSITDEPFLGGESYCQRGGFRITAKDLDTLGCGRAYMLAANLEDVETSQYLKKKCPPLQAVQELSTDVVNPVDRMTNTKRECYYELEEDENDEEVCNKTCYANNKVFKQNLIEDAEMCYLEEDEE